MEPFLEILVGIQEFFAEGHRPAALNKNPVQYLADEALKTMGDEGHLHGPGDQLTLLYVFHPNLATTRVEGLLAARSIIFSKIVKKEELIDSLNTFPHLRDELACIRF